MSAPIILPRLDPTTLAELRQRYEETPNPESRTRYQMILLAQQHSRVPQIARLVLRSEDTVARVLNRFASREGWTQCPGASRQAESSKSPQPGKRNCCA